MMNANGLDEWRKFQADQQAKRQFASAHPFMQQPLIVAEHPLVAAQMYKPVFYSYEPMIPPTLIAQKPQYQLAEPPAEPIREEV